ncbi:MAG: hypothetical protein BWY63_00001 [Chloroflexi bacterium ADurb.Bin360]|nr:MAG: hypothetical protein BWY63_00001 [Chloroflexi bacterium ADurb.Bin360]
MRLQAGCSWRSAGIGERVAIGCGDRHKRNQLVAEIHLTITAQIPAQIRLVGLPGQIGVKRAALRLSRQDVIHLRPRHWLALLQHAHLAATHTQRRGAGAYRRALIGTGDVVRLYLHTRLCHQPEDDVITLPQEAAAQHVPTIDVLQRRAGACGGAGGEMVAVRAGIE